MVDRWLCPSCGPKQKKFCEAVTYFGDRYVNEAGEVVEDGKIYDSESGDSIICAGCGSNQVVWYEGNTINKMKESIDGMGERKEHGRKGSSQRDH